ncbi:zinc finger protein 135-like isoform X1 [Nerophis ophidion]|uniref:zinc finger protein 135-like isoform X1 n=1 Tax=Nerophis ophidion TaxID=159077 RepID=UPI002AE05E9A|nr:zinc finger protein 135-like isoform X1 [Nerophis ophidion]
MCQIRTLKVLLSQQLTAAVEEIFVVLERTIAEYAKELSRTKEENERQRQLLDAVVKKPQVVLHRTDYRKEHLPPSEQQKWRSRKEQEEPEPPHLDDIMTQVGRTDADGDQIENDIMKQEVKNDADEDQMENLLPPLSDCEDMASNPSDVDEDSEAEATCQPDATRLTCFHCGDTLRSQLLLEEHVKRHTADKSMQCTREENLFKQEVQTGVNGDQLENLLPPLSDCDGMSSNISSSDSDDEDPGADADADAPLVFSHSGKTFDTVDEDPGAEADAPLVFSHSGKTFDSVDEDPGAEADAPLVFSHSGKTFDTVDEDPGAEADAPLVCSHSGKTFESKSLLNEHMKCHAAVKTVKCTVCGKRLSKGHFARHLRLHTGEKPYECSVCSERFMRSEAMNRHMRKHTEGKPYRCAVCNAEFSNRSGLIRHKRKHEDMKRFFCSVCKTSLPDRTSLIEHTGKHVHEGL